MLSLSQNDWINRRELKDWASVHLQQIILLNFFLAKAYGFIVQIGNIWNISSNFQEF